MLVSVKILRQGADSHSLLHVKWDVEDARVLLEIWDKVYVFILEVRDLQPNLGMYWYFFTEIFEQFRAFFLFVFHFQVRATFCASAT